MKVIAVVPIKLNNQRLPNKNIKKFTNGKPLCHYILSTLLELDGISEVCVFCSSEEIKKYLPEGITFVQRSKELDSDATKMNDILKAFALIKPADCYIMTHATAPFISANSIKRGLNAFLSGEYDSAFSVKLLQDFLWRNNRPLNYDLDCIPRTQDLEPIAEETSGFYIYNYDTICDLNRRIGQKPYLVEVSEIEAVDIDEPEDFVIADAIFNFVYCNKEGECGNESNTNS